MTTDFDEKDSFGTIITKAPSPEIKTGGDLIEPETPPVPQQIPTPPVGENFDEKDSAGTQITQTEAAKVITSNPEIGGQLDIVSPPSLDNTPETKIVTIDEGSETSEVTVATNQSSSQIVTSDTIKEDITEQQQQASTLQTTISDQQSNIAKLQEEVKQDFIEFKSLENQARFVAGEAGETIKLDPITPAEQADLTKIATAQTLLNQDINKFNDAQTEKIRLVNNSSQALNNKVATFNAARQPVDQLQAEIDNFNARSEAVSNTNILGWKDPNRSPNIEELNREIKSIQEQRSELEQRVNSPQYKQALRTTQELREQILADQDAHNTLVSQTQIEIQELQAPLLTRTEAIKADKERLGFDIDARIEADQRVRDLINNPKFQKLRQVNTEVQEKLKEVNKNIDSFNKIQKDVTAAQTKLENIRQSNIGLPLTGETDLAEIPQPRTPSLDTQITPDVIDAFTLGGETDLESESRRFVQSVDGGVQALEEGREIRRKASQFRIERATVENEALELGLTPEQFIAQQSSEGTRQGSAVVAIMPTTDEVEVFNKALAQRPDLIDGAAEAVQKKLGLDVVEAEDLILLAPNEKFRQEKIQEKFEELKKGQSGVQGGLDRFFDRIFDTDKSDEELLAEAEKFVNITTTANANDFLQKNSIDGFLSAEDAEKFERNYGIQFPIERITIPRDDLLLKDDSPRGGVGGFIDDVNQAIQTGERNFLANTQIFGKDHDEFRQKAFNASAFIVEGLREAVEAVPVGRNPDGSIDLIVTRTERTGENFADRVNRLSGNEFDNAQEVFRKNTETSLDFIEKQRNIVENPVALDKDKQRALELISGEVAAIERNRQTLDSLKPGLGTTVLRALTPSSPAEIGVEIAFLAPGLALKATKGAIKTATTTIRHPLSSSKFVVNTGIDVAESTLNKLPKLTDKIEDIAGRPVLTETGLIGNAKRLATGTLEKLQELGTINRSNITEINTGLPVRMGTQGDTGFSAAKLIDEGVITPIDRFVPIKESSIQAVTSTFAEDLTLRAQTLKELPASTVNAFKEGTLTVTKFRIEDAKEFVKNIVGSDALGALKEVTTENLKPILTVIQDPAGTVVSTSIKTKDTAINLVETAKDIVKSKIDNVTTPRGEITPISTTDELKRIDGDVLELKHGTPEDFTGLPQTPTDERFFTTTSDELAEVFASRHGLTKDTGKIKSFAVVADARMVPASDIVGSAQLDNILTAAKKKMDDLGLPSKWSKDNIDIIKNKAITKNFTVQELSDELFLIDRRVNAALDPENFRTLEQISQELGPSTFKNIEDLQRFGDIKGQGRFRGRSKHDVSNAALSAEYDIIAPHSKTSPKAIEALLESPRNLEFGEEFNEFIILNKNVLRDTSPIKSVAPTRTIIDTAETTVSSLVRGTEDIAFAAGEKLSDAAKAALQLPGKAGRKLEDIIIGPERPELVDPSLASVDKPFLAPKLPELSEGALTKVSRLTREKVLDPIETVADIVQHPKDTLLDVAEFPIIKAQAATDITRAKIVGGTRKLSQEFNSLTTDIKNAIREVHTKFNRNKPVRDQQTFQEFMQTRSIGRTPDKVVHIFDDTKLPFEPRPSMGTRDFETGFRVLEETDIQRIGPSASIEDSGKILQFEGETTTTIGFVEEGSALRQIDIVEDISPLTKIDETLPITNSGTAPFKPERITTLTALQAKPFAEEAAPVTKPLVDPDDPDSPFRKAFEEEEDIEEEEEPKKDPEPEELSLRHPAFDFRREPEISQERDFSEFLGVPLVDRSDENINTEVSKLITPQESVTSVTSVEDITEFTPAQAEQIQIEADLERGQFRSQLELAELPPVTIKSLEDLLADEPVEIFGFGTPTLPEEEIVVRPKTDIPPVEKPKVIPIVGDDPIIGDDPIVDLPPINDPSPVPILPPIGKPEPILPPIEDPNTEPIKPPIKLPLPISPIVPIEDPEPVPEPEPLPELAENLKSSKIIPPGKLPDEDPNKSRKNLPSLGESGFQLIRETENRQVTWTLTEQTDEGLEIRNTFGPFNVRDIILSDTLSNKGKGKLRRVLTSISKRTTSRGEDLILSLIALGQISLDQAPFIIPFEVKVDQNALNT